MANAFLLAMLAAGTPAEDYSDLEVRMTRQTREWYVDDLAE